MTLLRSNVEFTKRVFLDRLTTDQQNLDAPNNIDQGPGDTYQYSNCFDPYNFGIGADCSGLCGIMCGAAIFGAVQMFWGRLFSTETFAAWAEPLGFIEVTQSELISSTSPLKVMVMNGGGGPDSHMAMWLDGVNMESNGTYGTCTAVDEITGVTSDYWNHWYVYNGTITEDTTERQPMGYPQGLDYAGGVIPGAELVANGITFVCRYINPGGSGLPAKQLLVPEFIDLCRNGIQVVFNFETDATFELEDDGATDAGWALSYVQGLLNAAAAAGIPTSWYAQPVIYFSADFDEAPSQDLTVENYLSGAKSVLGVNGLGKSCAGLYGAYYLCMRAQQVGAVDYIWQTEAWSGGNIWSGVNIMQRNGAGYRQIAGVQCDIDEQHTDDIGAFRPGPVAPQPNPAPLPTPTPAPVSASTYYVVQQGDTLYGIAQNFGITLAELLTANPSIGDPNLIQVGQSIIIPN